MKSQLQEFGSKGSNLILLIVFAILLNAVASFLYFRVDLTDEKLFTLSEGTREIIAKSDGDLTIKLFISRSLEGVPLGVENYGEKVKEILTEYKNLSEGKINLEILDPKPDSEIEEWALKYGLSSAPLGSGDNFFLGAVLILAGDERKIPFFDPSREQYLEYDITQAISEIQKTGKKKIGILSSLNIVNEIPNMPQMRGMKLPESWLFVKELKKSFEIEKVKSDVTNIPSDIDLLMVMHPKKLSEATLYAIDQYVMRGGRLMAFVDPFSRTDQQQNSNKQMQGQMPSFSSDLNQLLKSYGASVNPAEVAADPTHAMRVNTGAGGVVSYPVWMQLGQSNMNQKAIITADLETMMIMDAGSISNEKKEGIEFQALIETSKEAGVVPAIMLQFGNPGQIAKQMKDKNEKLVLAALLKGKFSSAFSATPASTKSEAKHILKSEAENSIFIFSDIDFIYDSNSVRKMNFLGQTLLSPINDNLNFLTNSVEFISGDQSLIKIRSRGKFSRPFLKVKELQKEAENKWQAEEEALSKKVQEIQDKINQLQTERQGNKIVLSEAQLKEIQNAQKEMSKTKKARREVRRLLREDIESLGNNLLAANLLVVPFLLSIFALFKSRKRKS